MKEDDASVSLLRRRSFSVISHTDSNDKPLLSNTFKYFQRKTFSLMT